MEILSEFDPSRSIEANLEKESPYKESALIEKVKKTQKIAFLDIDSTITSSDKELQLQARQKLEEAGFAIVFVTARTYEMQISDQKRLNSPELERPPAQLERDEELNKLKAVDPQSLEGMKGLIDPDAIIDTTGAHIVIQQKEGNYRLDQEYNEKLKTESAEWRNFCQKLIEIANSQEEICQVKPIDNPGAYEAGEVDVYLPDFRMQITFSSAENKNKFNNLLNDLKHQSPDTLSQYGEGFREQLLRLRLTDDSKPKSDEYSVYLMPKFGTKQRSVEEVIKNICQETAIPRKDLELLIAGDGFPDLAMGLYGGLDTKATFLVVVGSRLTSALTEREIDDFAGEGLSSVKKRLAPTERKGEYTFKPPVFNQRDVIIGDEAYPSTKAPETIIAYLEAEKLE